MANDHVIHFNKDDYNKLIKMIGDDQTDLENSVLKPGRGMMLDDKLPTFVKPGSADWTPAGAIHDGCTAFGPSVAEKLGRVDDELVEFGKLLKKVSDVFTDCDDLASMSAQDFLDKYPDFQGGGLGGGGGG